MIRLLPVSFSLSWQEPTQAVLVDQVADQTAPHGLWNTMHYEFANKKSIIASEIFLKAQQRRRQNMYYRVAIRREGDQLDRLPSWQWKSTVFSSRQALFHFLRLSGALPPDQLMIFSSPSRESLEEQFSQGNTEFISHSITAQQFLQEWMIHSLKRIQRGPEQEGGEDQEPASDVVDDKTWSNENRNTAHTLDEGNMCRLSRRRLELEFGPGADHDIAYSFALPTSILQVLVWMSLLAKVHRRELKP
jgi:hypothetical protein